MTLTLEGGGGVLATTKTQILWNRWEFLMMSNWLRDDVKKTLFYLGDMSQQGEEGHQDFPTFLRREVGTKGGGLRG